MPCACGLPHHNPLELRRYERLPRLILPPCRFKDAAYMAQARRLFPKIEFINQEIDLPPLT